MSDKKKSLLRKQGILFRSILNDLKRDEATAAKELGLDPNELLEMLNGKREIPYSLIQQAAAIWPVNERDFFLIRDDSERDLVIFDREKSFQSRRILSRGGTPYYEYRDTAMSRLAHFRPEWIEMLVQTEGENPEHSAVQWNKGHFLYQFTFFVGEINYYYEAAGKKHCLAMKTGDSVFGLPYFPHSFTKRGNEKAFILALTFGNRLLGDAQQELVALGADKAEAFCFKDGSGLFSFAALLLKACEDASLSLEELAAKSTLPLGEIELYIEERKSPSYAELELLAEALQISTRELVPTVSDTKNGIKIQSFKSAPTWMYPDEETPFYRCRQLAKSVTVPGMQPLLIEPLTSHESASYIRTSLHQYGYHIGENPVKLTWIYEGATFSQQLMPGDSFYMKPFVLHSFSKEGREHQKSEESPLKNSLLILRISGKLASDEITECSLLGGQTIRRFVSDAEKWYA